MDAVKILWPNSAYPDLPFEYTHMEQSGKSEG